MNPTTSKVAKGKGKQARFPVARIKKIMQTDDNVGKVAQATPIVISRALELFLQDLLKDTMTLCEERGVKRVEAYHLKHVVNTVETFDFLKEVFQGVQDPTNGGQISEASLSESKPKRKRKAKANPILEDADDE